jgi:hypothetical protein
MAVSCFSVTTACAQFDHGRHNPVSREELVGIIDATYSGPFNFAAERSEVVSAVCKLTILLLALACGELFEDSDVLNPQQINPGQDFYHSARIAVGLFGIFDTTSPLTIQVLVRNQCMWDDLLVHLLLFKLLMSNYLFFADKNGPGNTRWILTGVAVKIAQILGMRMWHGDTLHTHLIRCQIGMHHTLKLKTKQNCIKEGNYSGNFFRTIVFRYASAILCRSSQQLPNVECHIWSPPVIQSQSY